MAELYKPSYVDFWKKSGSRFNLEDYTRLVGSRLFPESSIYRPLTIAVAMNPDVSYNLQVDTIRQDWNEVLCNGVKKMMGVAPHMEVTLKDDLGRDISSLSVRDLVHVGLVYPYLENGRFASKKVDVNMEIPPILSTNKRALFKGWMDKVSDRVVDLVSSSLAECPSVAEVGRRLTLKSPASIKNQISKAIDAEFEKQADLHTTDPDVNHAELAEKASNLIMAAVVEGFKHNKDRVRDYYQVENQQQQHTLEDRNIFESDVVNRAGMLLRDEYPTPKDLFADIIQTSMEKENIGHLVYHNMTHRPRRVGVHLPTIVHHHRHRHENKHRGKHRTKYYHPHHGKSYEMDDGTRKTVLALSHKMNGLPTFRDTVTISCNGAPSAPFSKEKKGSMKMEGLPSLYSAEPPSIEPIDDVRSMPSIEPMPRITAAAPTSRGDNMPELESASFRPRVEKGVPELESVSFRPRVEKGVPELETDPTVWFEDTADELPPALEAMFSSDEEPYVPVVANAKSTPKYRGTAPAIVVDTVIGTKATEIKSSGLPSLTEMKKALGLHMDASTSSSSLMGEFSASIDGPVYGKSVDVVSHYIDTRSRNRGYHPRKNPGRRVFVLNRSMTPVAAQEIQEYDNLSDVEESIAPFVSSSYESGSDGTIAFVTADGKDHKIRPDGVHIVDGRRLPLRVEKLVEQEIRGEPMLLVLERNN